jgi:hypothetical protein
LLLASNNYEPERWLKFCEKLQIFHKTDFRCTKLILLTEKTTFKRIVISTYTGMFETHRITDRKENEYFKHDWLGLWAGVATGPYSIQDTPTVKGYFCKAQ